MQMDRSTGMKWTRWEIFSWKIPRKKKSLLWFLYFYLWSAFVLVIIQYIVMVSRIYKTNLYTAYKHNRERCIDPPCLVKCSGQGGGFVSCSPKYIIKKLMTDITCLCLSYLTNIYVIVQVYIILSPLDLIPGSSDCHSVSFPLSYKVCYLWIN